jgi:hypothetical protein
MQRIPPAALGALLGLGRHVFAVPWRHTSLGVHSNVLYNYYCIQATSRTLKIVKTAYSSSERGVMGFLKHRQLPT